MTFVLSLLSTADWAALTLFLAGWFGYGWFADRAARSERGLRGVTSQLRLDWARQMVARDNRITDAALTGNLMTSVSFYANTTIYIIAGLIAVAGTLDQLMTFTKDLPFAKQTTKTLLEGKLFLMIAIFVFAYFKFTWALRQYNFLSILIGGAPPPEGAPALLEAHAQKFARLSTLAGDEFNRGIRAYYFGFAALGWFAAPALFGAATLLILAVLWRRDFHSATLATLAK
ncbi:MAG TPA: DUF599 domain-containing protein [Casimicrobiaceae bacterium]|nr:DUF599 domain-containing protein [Casimicrobiaceae bacterium]